MPDTPSDERRFTDREVREILERAVRDAPSRSLTRSEGLTLAELKAIGKEVGIDPARLEDAARAITLKGGHRPNRLVGAPTVLHFERRVEGEFDLDDTPEIVSLIRRIMGQQGEVAELHGSLEWTAKGEAGERYVTLSRREGTTTVSGSANLTNAAIITYLPTGIVGALASLVGLLKFAKDGTTVGLIVFFAVLPILYSILRTIFGKISASESSRLQQVVDSLARLSEGSDADPG